MLSLVESLGQRARTLARCGRDPAGRARCLARATLCAFALAASNVLAVSNALAEDPVPAGDDPAEAEERAPKAARPTDVTPEEAAARALADDALQAAHGAEENAGLEEWARSVMRDSLEEAGEVAPATAAASRSEAGGETAAPLPAERQAAAMAAGLEDRPHIGEVLVFMSLSVPEPSWAQWAAEAARAGAPLVLRGVSPGGLQATVKAVGARLGGHDAGVAIDPRLFRLFGVARVPAVIAVPGGVPACASPGCADDGPPPFDIVAGNIGLAAALEAIAAEGAAGRAVAQVHLERLRARP